MRKKPQVFPVGLYGMLLFALCWLTLPSVFAPLERWLVGGACVVGRTLASVLGEPAQATSPEARQRLALLTAELTARVEEHGVRGAGTAWTRGASPVHCAVLEASNPKKLRGGGGEVCELRLDHTYAELAGCRQLVTKGDAFVGFLQRVGFGAAVDDRADDLARVVLPNHPLCRALHAEVQTADDAWLRFVVRGGAPVDPAPLRVELWDDPYRAAHLDRAGLAVRTREVAGGTPVPAGLLLGSTRIWGYPRTDGGPALTLGVYVAPAFLAGALSHVVLWRDDAEGEPLRHEPPSGSSVRRSGVVHDLPGALHGRHLLVGAGRVADGAAVVQSGYLLGTAKGLAFGAGLVTSFASSRHRWSLILLPDDAAAMPIELSGEVVRSQGEWVVVRCRRSQVGDAQRLPPGHLFTGSNGPHCPSGLWIGRAVADPTAFDGLVVTVPVDHGTRTVEVHGSASRDP